MAIYDNTWDPAWQTAEIQESLDLLEQLFTKLGMKLVHAVEISDEEMRILFAAGSSVKGMNAMVELKNRHTLKATVTFSQADAVQFQMRINWPVSMVMLITKVSAYFDGWVEAPEDLDFNFISPLQVRAMVTVFKGLWDYYFELDENKYSWAKAMYLKMAAFQKKLLEHAKPLEEVKGLNQAQRLLWDMLSKVYELDKRLVQSISAVPQVGAKRVQLSVDVSVGDGKGTLYLSDLAPEEDTKTVPNGACATLVFYLDDIPYYMNLVLYVGDDGRNARLTHLSVGHYVSGAFGAVGAEPRATAWFTKYTHLQELAYVPHIYGGHSALPLPNGDYRIKKKALDASRMNTVGMQMCVERRSSGDEKRRSVCFGLAFGLKTNALPATFIVEHQLLSMMLQQIQPHAITR